MPTATPEFVARLIEVLRTQTFDANRLSDLARRVVCNKSISEADREDLLEAISSKLWEISAKKAKAIFGARDEMARQQLGTVIAALDHVDLSGNAVKNGVKTGGLMLTGEYHLNVYASYKTATGASASIEIDQRTLSDPVEVVVRLRQVGGPQAGTISEQTWAIAEFPEAGAEYQRIVQSLVSAPTQ